jgi:hypothetical protein
MKYCDNCVHYLFKNNQHLCKAFGNFYTSINNKIIKKYYNVEYTRNHRQLCGMDGNLYVNKEEQKLYNQLVNNMHFNKRVKKLK